MRGRRGRQRSPVHVREQHAAALEHAAVLDQPRDAAAAFGPRPGVAAERLAVDRLEAGDDARLQVEKIGADRGACPSASLARRRARGGRCRCGTACRRSGCRRSAAYAARCAWRTESPSAVTHSTRPPLTTVSPSASAVPAWNTMTSGCASGVMRSRPSITSPLRGSSGIAGRREHDAERRAPVPLGVDRVERAVDRVLEQVDEVGLEPQHDRLRFRVAHAAVEFEHLRIAGARRSSRRRRGIRCRECRPPPCRSPPAG